MKEKLQSAKWKYHQIKALFPNNWKNGIDDIRTKFNLIIILIERLILIIIPILIAIYLDSNLEFPTNYYIQSDKIIPIAVATLGLSGVLLGLYVASFLSIFNPNKTNPKFDYVSSNNIFYKFIIKNIGTYTLFSFIFIMNCLTKPLCGPITLFLFLSYTLYTLFVSIFIGNKWHMMVNKILDKEKSDSIQFIKTAISSKNKNESYIIRQKCIDSINNLNVIYKQYTNDDMKIQYFQSTLGILFYYWKVKRQIPIESNWFPEIYKQKQWIDAKYIEATLSIDNSCNLNPISIADYLFLEKRLTENYSQIYREFLKNKNFSKAYHMIELLFDEEIIKTAINANEGKFYYTIIKSIYKIHIISSQKPIDKEMYSLFENIVTSIEKLIDLTNSYYSKDLSKAIEHACNTIGNKKVDYAINPFLNTKNLIKLYNEIQNEYLIEKRKITPDNYISDLIYSEVYNEFHNNITQFDEILEDINKSEKELLTTHPGYCWTLSIIHYRIIDSIQKNKETLTHLSEKYKNKNNDEKIIETMDKIEIKQLKHQIISLRSKVYDELVKNESEFIEITDCTGYLYLEIKQRLIDSIIELDLDSCKYLFELFIKINKTYSRIIDSKGDYRVALIYEDLLFVSSCIHIFSKIVDNDWGTILNKNCLQYLKSIIKINELFKNLYFNIKTYDWNISYFNKCSEITKQLLEKGYLIYKNKNIYGRCVICPKLNDIDLFKDDIIDYIKLIDLLKNSL